MKIGLLAAKTAGAGALAATWAQVSLASNHDCTPGSDPLTRGIDCAKPTGAKGDLFGAGSIFQTVADTLIFLVGAIAVIMLIIGGLMYVLSQGNKDSITNAKNTILYAIIGIVVAVLAFAAVRFVAGQVG